MQVPVPQPGAHKYNMALASAACTALRATLEMALYYKYYFAKTGLSPPTQSAGECTWT